jgi:hypothetical protein
MYIVGASKSSLCTFIFIKVASPSVGTWNQTVEKISNIAIVVKIFRVSEEIASIHTDKSLIRHNVIYDSSFVTASLVKHGGISSTQISKSVSFGSEVPTMIKYVAVSHLPGRIQSAQLEDHHNRRMQVCQYYYNQLPSKNTTETVVLVVTSSRLRSTM